MHVVRKIPEGLLRMFREEKHVIISSSSFQCMWSDFRKDEILGMEAMEKVGPIKWKRCSGYNAQLE